MTRIEVAPEVLDVFDRPIDRPAISKRSRVPQARRAAGASMIEECDQSERLACWSVGSPAVSAGCAHRHDPEPSCRAFRGWRRPPASVASDRAGTARAERLALHRKFRDECPNEQAFETLRRARTIVTRSRREDNEVRPHSSCQRMRPAKFEPVQQPQRSIRLASPCFRVMLCIA